LTAASSSCVTPTPTTSVSEPAPTDSGTPGDVVRKP
jgi:hypothetical protein